MNENNNLNLESDSQNVENEQMKESESTSTNESLVDIDSKSEVTEKKPKKNKGLIIILIVIIIGLISFIVCDKFILGNDKVKEEKTEEKDEIKKEDKKEQQDSINKTNEDNNQTTTTSTNSETNETTKNLTKEQLNSFVSYFNEKEVNGFVTQVYNSPNEVNLNEVVYNFRSKEITLEEANAVLTAEDPNGPTVSNLNELPTSIKNITKTEALRITKKYLGIENLSNLKWTYLKEYDTYYDMHGDTNYIAINSCSSGKIDEKGNYIVTCTNSEGTFEATMKKSNDAYMFLSNKCVKDCEYMYTRQ